MEQKKAHAPSDSQHVITLLATGDIHDAFGMAPRLRTLLSRYHGEDTLLLDAGDIAMGTLYQAAYTQGFGLRMLGRLGYFATTPGNHDLDPGCALYAASLRAAAASGDPLPLLLTADMDLTGDLTPEQEEMKAALLSFGAKPYAVRQIGGSSIGIFGVMGRESRNCFLSPLPFRDHIAAAKETAALLRKKGCDTIICLSHSGVSADGTSGDDIRLAKAVPDIDIILSGHSHVALDKPVHIGKTVILSCGHSLRYLGKLTFTPGKDGIHVHDHELIPIDASIEEDRETLALLEDWKARIAKESLSGSGLGFDTVICRSNRSTVPAYAQDTPEGLYSTGELIADSCLYAVRQAGIRDIDIAFVGRGTIRANLHEGDITLADAFEVCSLGIGKDGSPGHALAAAWAKGSDIRLLLEADASLSGFIGSVRMSFAGLRYTFHPEGPLMGRISRIFLIRPDGTEEEISDDSLLRVCANEYGFGMMRNMRAVTHGLMRFTLRDARGKAVSAPAILKNPDGTDLKEWRAFTCFLMSFPKGPSGVPLIPERHSHSRKTPENGPLPRRGTLLKALPRGTRHPVRLIGMAAAKIIRAKQRRKTGHE